jgi:PTH2 family peptidyl-tRNA hydrolase
MQTKQVIVMRTDTDPPMRKGKMIAQGSHASMAFLSRRVFDSNGNATSPKFTEAEYNWFNNSFVKICVRVDSEKELLEIYEKAKEQNLEAHLIQDSAKTEFKEPTYTCVAIGPDECSKIDAVTSGLKLL